ncbi:MAG TPA: hypothetical protein DEF85_10555 [Clostridiaceae bacterium]|nr:hypothetical protein [Clostridiaceae bacterium]HBG39256.1 hypothetical protein [Clostridiaceae bacterium]HBN27943.1 hypothetical protein [Clostridiaceae bacterium]HBX49316.1 hypothetical protein [Clostridiaceae bacterium]HCL50797.1 hypothetical protein [Clostridiaceae bacterium]
MKLKIYVVKKNQIIWAAIIIAIIIISIILLVNLNKSQTMKTIDSVKTFNSADVDNDGKSDSIVINKTDEENQKYSVSVYSSSGKIYDLQPDISINSLGTPSDWWPINLIVKDIDKDNTKEIIIQSSDSNGPILHIFKYINNSMERIASGRYSFVGNISLPPDDQNIVVLGLKSNDKLNLTYLTPKGNRLVPYTDAPASLTLGKDALLDVISYIEKSDTEAFSINMDSKFASILPKGIFLDCSLEDTKFSSYNIPSECTYIIRTASLDSNSKASEIYKVKLTLDKYNNEEPQYIITNINKIK